MTLSLEMITVDCTDPRLLAGGQRVLRGRAPALSPH